MKARTLIAVTAVAGALYVVSPAAKADVMFGAAQNAACTTASGPGFVCNSANVTFTSGVDSVTAHGFPGAPGSGAGTSDLTQKLIATNGLSESGIGSSPTIHRRCAPFRLRDLPAAIRLGDPFRQHADHRCADRLGASRRTFNFFVQTIEGGAFTQLGGRSLIPASARASQWRERTCAVGMRRRVRLALALRFKP